MAPMRGKKKRNGGGFVGKLLIFTISTSRNKLQATHHHPAVLPPHHPADVDHSTASKPAQPDQHIAR